jgi:hypothetical protein
MAGAASATKANNELGTTDSDPIPALELCWRINLHKCAPFCSIVAEAITARMLIIGDVKVRARNDWFGQDVVYACSILGEASSERVHTLHMSSICHDNNSWHRRQRILTPSQVARLHAQEKCEIRVREATLHHTQRVQTALLLRQLFIV